MGLLWVWYDGRRTMSWMCFGLKESNVIGQIRIAHKSQMTVQYGILSNIVCVLYFNGKIVIRVIIFVPVRFCTQLWWSNMCFHILPPELVVLTAFFAGKKREVGWGWGFDCCLINGAFYMCLRVYNSGGQANKDVRYMGYRTFKTKYGNNIGIFKYKTSRMCAQMTGAVMWLLSSLHIK